MPLFNFSSPEYLISLLVSIWVSSPLLYVKFITHMCVLYFCIYSVIFFSCHISYCGTIIKSNQIKSKNRVSPVSRATHVKISQLVPSLQRSRQQVVFARLVTSCQQVWNKLLTTCNNLVDIIRLVTRLFQQYCYNHDITILL